MAFCRNCGTSLNEETKFCSSCGAPTGDASRAGVSDGRAPATAATAVAKPGITPAVKILLGLLCAFVIVALLGVGAVFYAGYRVHQKAQEVSQITIDSTAGDPSALLNEIAKALPDSGANAVPVPNGRASGNSPQPSRVAQQGPASKKLEARHVDEKDGQCAIFTKEELTRVLGDPFTHADADATGCVYKGDGRGQYVRTEIVWQGGHKLLKDKADSLAFLRQSMVNQHYSKAEIDAHEFPVGKPYPGVGDEGWITMWPVVTGRKGDVGVSIDLRAYPPSDEINRMLVNTALERLADKKSASAASPTQ